MIEGKIHVFSPPVFTCPTHLDVYSNSQQGDSEDLKVQRKNAQRADRSTSHFEKHVCDVHADRSQLFALVFTAHGPGRSSRLRPLTTTRKLIPSKVAFKHGLAIVDALPEKNKTPLQLSNLFLLSLASTSLVFDHQTTFAHVKCFACSGVQAADRKAERSCGFQWFRSWSNRSDVAESTSCAVFEFMPTSVHHSGRSLRGTLKNME